MSKWVWRKKPLLEVPEGSYGFVYKITVLKGPYKGYIYVGQKSFTSKKTLSKKQQDQLWSGRGKKPKKAMLESNWKTYCSSSEDVKKLVAEMGVDKFKWEVLELACNKSDLNLKEVEWMVTEMVLRIEKSFNKWMSFKIRKEQVVC